MANKVFTFLKASVLISLIALIWVIVLVCFEVRPILSSLSKSATHLTLITRTTQEYLDEQVRVLRSPSQQAAMKAGLEAAGTVKATFQKINVLTLPKVNKALDTLNQDLVNLGDGVDAFKTLVERTDDRVNDSLLPESDKVIKSVSAAATQAAVVLKTTGEDIHSLLADPSLGEALNNIEGSTEQLKASSDHIEEALRRAPKVAENIENITGNASKVSKLLSIGRLMVVLSTLYSLIF